MTNLLSVFKHVDHVPQSFHGCYDTSTGMERPSLVKLPIEEGMVKLLPSANSFCSSYYFTSSFIKLLRLTHDG